MINVISSFNVNDAELASKFISTFEKHWPASVKLTVWHHGGPLDQSKMPFSRVTYMDLDKEAMWLDFLSKTKDVPESKDYRFDLKRFAPKLYSLFSTNLEQTDWLIWLDADTETFADVTEQDLTEWLGGDAVFLDRVAMNNCESSFFALNTKSEGTARMMHALANVYHSGEILNYKEFHDGFVLTRLFRIFQFAGLSIRSLTPNVEGLDAFAQSPLGQKMVHYKGPAKQGKPTIVVDQKYEILSEVVGFYKPTSLFFDAMDDNRVVQLICKAAESSDNISVGFKARTKTLHARLQGLGMILAKGGKTLKLEVNNPIDFAFYDGKNFFDDTQAKVAIMENYLPLNAFNKDVRGPSTLFDTIGSTMAMGPFALRLLEGTPKFEPKRPMRVQPRNAVDPTFLIENVKKNTPKFSKWVPRIKPHGREAILISAGPTLEEQIPTIKQLLSEGNEKFILCVKHALPVLIKHGIEPDACVVLDARPLEGISTHSVKRKDLYDNVSEKTAFYIASMCAPETVDYLLTLGNEVKGWHAANEGMMNAGLVEFNTGLLVSGGTCAAWRQFAIAHVMGFRTFHLFGYDFYYREGETSTNEILEAFVGPNKKKYRTSGELIAALQDFEHIQRIVTEQGLMLYCYGDGMIAEVWRQPAGFEEWKS